MNKLFIALLLTAAAAAGAQAQSTVVTGTATDSQATPYIGGTWTVTLKNTSTSAPIWQGSTSFRTEYGGSLDTTGSLAVTLPSNTGTGAITVGGLKTTQWQFNICARDGGTCFIAAVTITGTSQSISASLVNSSRITFVDGEPNQPPCGSNQVIVSLGATSWGCVATSVINVPGGSNTQVQFNDAGSFNGDAGLTYNKATDTLTIGSIFFSGGQPWVDVAAYGAVCDGSTDDTTAIAAAITAVGSTNGTLFFPNKGSPCVVSSALTISQSMLIRGRSKYSPTVKLANSSNSEIFSVTSSNVTFSDMQIDGNKANNSGTHAAIKYATTLSDLHLTDVSIINTTFYGVWFISDSNVQISNCTISGAVNSQFYYGTTAGVTSSNITISNSTLDSAGKSLGTAVTSPFVNLFFDASGAGSVVSNIAITGNQIYWPITGATEGNGIVLDGQTATAGSIDGVVISSNLIWSPAGTRNAGQNDIELSSVNDVSVVGNTFVNGYNGVLVEGASPSNINITGNVLTTQPSAGNSFVGVYINPNTGTATNVTVVGNTFNGWVVWSISENRTTGGTTGSNVATIPNVTAASGFQCNVCEAVAINSNQITSNYAGAYILNSTGATAKYLSYRGNVIKGVGYGFILAATAYTATVIQGTIFDGISTANQYYAGGGPFTNVTIIDDSIPSGAWTCTNVTPVTVSANVTTDQNLMACTIPAQTLNRVGRTLRIFAAGVYSTPAGSVAQMTFQVKLCTVSGCGSGTVISPINIQTTALGAIAVTAENWKIDSRTTTQTAGASSAYESHGDLTIDLTNLTTGADSIFGDTNTATVGTIDSTAAIFLQITGAFSTASASNSFTQRQLIVETVN